MAKLTERQACAAPAPTSGYKILYDGGPGAVRGFGLRVTRAGAKSFVLNYRARGVERRLTMGSYPDWSVAAARKEAARLKQGIDQGRDPMAERHEERAAASVADLCARYLEDHVSKRRAHTFAEYQAMIDQWIVPELGNRKVGDIDFVDVDRLHRKISKRTPVRTNRVIAVLSAAFSASIRWGMRTDNPTRGIERNAEQPKSRYLTPDELTRLLAVLAQQAESTNVHTKTGIDAIRLLLLTGARRREVLGARWDEFDMDAGTWTKPYGRMKAGREHRVPLSEQALALLLERRGNTSSQFVFPGRAAGDRPLFTIQRIWERARKNARLEDVRLHDLRHSYASFLASSGSSLPVIGALLGHSRATTTGRYAHLLDAALRDATGRVGSIVAAADRRRKGDKVVALHKS